VIVLLDPSSFPLITSVASQSLVQKSNCDCRPLFPSTILFKFHYHKSANFSSMFWY